MISQVYYRKWRPQRLDQLVGQEPIVHTLKQAISRNRVAHAYLFCGPRGTGKTSTSRILAKAVNCLEPLDAEPCNTCRLCTAVNEGHALDLMEIDAASNRGIDEIRSIREKIRYTPAEATYKIYVLDEAHMLTDAAADALLKTLEEPPAHVIFILATTEPHRLPSTIVSRCQRFDFRRIHPDTITKRLAQLCVAEGIEAEAGVLHSISRHAAGSLRDAENLLEQAATSFGNPLAKEQVRLLLGQTSDDRVRSLINLVLHSQVPEALVMLNNIAAEGLDIRQLHLQMLNELRDLLLLKSGAHDMVAQPDEVKQEQSTVVAQVPMEQLIHTLRLAGQVSFRHDVPTTLPLELAIIESAHQEAVHDGNGDYRLSSSADVQRSTTAPRPHPYSQEAKPTTPSPAASHLDQGWQPEQPDYAKLPTIVAQPTSPAGSGSSPPVSPERVPADLAQGSELSSRLEREWVNLVKTLSRHKGRRFNMGALLRGCPERHIEGDTLFLGFTHGSHMERMKEEMDNPESRRVCLEVITTALGITTPLKLNFTSPKNQDSTDGTWRSPLLQAALGMGGKILEETKEHHE